MAVLHLSEVALVTMGLLKCQDSAVCHTLSHLTCLKNSAKAKTLKASHDAVSTYEKVFHSSLKEMYCSFLACYIICMCVFTNVCVYTWV